MDEFELKELIVLMYSISSVRFEKKLGSSICHTDFYYPKKNAFRISRIFPDTLDFPFLLGNSIIFQKILGFLVLNPTKLLWENFLDSEVYLVSMLTRILIFS